MENEKSLNSKYKYVETEAGFGFQEAGCGCAGKKSNPYIFELDMDKLLLYVGFTTTVINGHRVYPNMLVLGLSDSDFEIFKNDSRFRIPGDKEKKSLYGKFGK